MIGSDTKIAISLVLFMSVMVSGCVERDWYADIDGDGYGDPDAITSSAQPPDSHVADNSDCDDSDFDINPGATEILDDDLDNDCDGNVDAYKVFVTSLEYSGNLGGLAGADNKCNELADASGVPGTYRAWLSTIKESAASRLSPSQTSRPDLSYVRIDEKPIASNWADLTDGALEVPITVDETEFLVDDDVYPIVWTNTEIDGESRNSSNLFNSCQDWTSSDSGISTTGKFENNGQFWTDSLGYPCSNEFRLYCVQY